MPYVRRILQTSLLVSTRVLSLINFVGAPRLISTIAELFGIAVPNKFLHYFMEFYKIEAINK
jgi:hypothetical protein